jgi:3-demethoxyubiquinol 3-hydroxylase
MRNLSGMDRLLSAGARIPIVFGSIAPGPLSVGLEPVRASSLVHSSPQNNAAQTVRAQLSDKDRELSGALMRVNHVGEVCAQALYEAQALMTHDPALRAQMLQAAQDERRHLVWVQARLDQLGARPSLLNPVWFAGAFALGLGAGFAGDAVSLGFVAETEKQVEAHLAGHLSRLPAQDIDSREVVERMRLEEQAHGQWALERGGTLLPWPVRLAMKASARLMTAIAHCI